MEMVRAEFSSKGSDASPVSLQSDIPSDMTVSVSRVQIVHALRTF
jgi:hypothetical protein